MMRYQLVSYMLRVRVDALKEKYVQALPFLVIVDVYRIKSELNVVKNENEVLKEENDKYKRLLIILM